MHLSAFKKDYPYLGPFIYNALVLVKSVITVRILWFDYILMLHQFTFFALLVTENVISVQFFFPTKIGAFSVKKCCSFSVEEGEQ